ncbi:MAG: hypothetical protein JJ913_06965 [Rhizobiaceae bacterium]|nr:hypothetical protein [Rhizobiaceae bacterium]
MQSILGPVLLGTAVLAVLATRTRSSGARPRVMTFPGVDEFAALCITVAAAFGLLVTISLFTPLF